MVKRPQNIDDLTQCIKIKNGKVLVYCVECEEWVSVARMFNAIVTSLQVGGHTQERLGEDRFICRYCKADVKYLLTEQHKEIVRSKARDN